MLFLLLFVFYLILGGVGCHIVNHPLILHHLTIVAQAHDELPSRNRPLIRNTWLIDELYQKLHASPQDLVSAFHYIDVVPAVTHGVISGSIVCLWFPVLKQYLSTSTLALDIMEKKLINALPAIPPLVSAFEQTPTSTGHLISTFHNGLETIQNEVQAYMPSQFVPYRIEERQYSGRELVTAWWSKYDNLVQVFDGIIDGYTNWRTTMAEWVDYTTALGVNRQSLALALHQYDHHQSFYAEDLLERSPLTVITEILIRQIENNRFFYMHPSRAITPYAVEVPVLLETASPTKMAQLFCSEFSCTEAMLNVINVVDYSNYPDVLNELTHQLTEQRRWMDKDELTASQKNARLVSDTYRYTVSLPTACRKDAHARLLCDMCSYYMTPIQFYLSQMDILNDYRADLPYLLDLVPNALRKLPLDFDGFNDYLSRIYRDVSPFFGIQDSLLSYWLIKDWKKDITDLYVLFREDQNLWISIPPKTLTEDNALAIHQVDLSAYSLQSFWRRFFQIIRKNRIGWWGKLLSIASVYDAYIDKSSVHSDHGSASSSLTTQCRTSDSIFDCICAIHERFIDPSLSDLFTEMQKRALLVKSQHLYGKLEIYTAMAEKLREATPLSFRSKFKKWISSSSSQSQSNDLNQQIPSLRPLSSDRKMLANDFEKVFTIDTDGNIINADRDDIATTPPKRPKLKTKKSLWRQFHG